jgi:predicted nucleic acid-binding protein
VKLMLDTNVLLEICVPGRHKDAKEWFKRLLLAPSSPELLVSVVTEYELRRGLHHTGAKKSMEHFEDMSTSLRFVALSTETTRRAASLSSQSQLSDADVIIAAQALAEGAVLVTADQVFHSVPDLTARHWTQIDPDHLEDIETGSG